ncbi:hypothetical protein AB2L57_10655 [Microbacterium sp. HA-8]|uniref:hypothetical protein n=1 Tax=Microbacterium sp. HA-8 TaxID=3234200 RepID=UPI0038F63D92
MAAGLRFDRIGPELSYDDAYAYLRHLAWLPTSAVYRVTHGHSWGMTESMLAHLFDRLGWLGEVTAKSNGAKWRGGHVQPFPRPKPLRGEGPDTNTRGEALPLEDVLAWMTESENDDGQEDSN